MSIIILVMPVQPPTRELLDSLASSGDVVTWELWSSDGFYCPHCGTKSGRIPHGKADAYACVHCGQDYSCRVEDGGSFVTASHKPNPQPDEA